MCYSKLSNMKNILIGFVLAVVILGGGYIAFTRIAVKPDSQGGDAQNATTTESVAPVTTQVQTTEKKKPATPAPVSGYVFHPVAMDDERSDLKNVTNFSLERGAVATLSWNMPDAESCFIYASKDWRYPDQYSGWKDNLPPSGSIQSDEIFFKNGYQLICSPSFSPSDPPSKVPWSATIVFIPLPATELPSCTLTAAPSSVHEGEIVTYTFSSKHAATISMSIFPAFPPEPLSKASFPIPVKAKKESPSLSVTVGNEVGSATCTATAQVI